MLGMIIAEMIGLGSLLAFKVRIYVKKEVIRKPLRS